jgi:hypothetical protein
MTRLKPPPEVSSELLQHVLLRGFAVLLTTWLVLGGERSVPDTALMLSTILSLIGIDQMPLHELLRPIDVRKTLLGRERFVTSPLGAVCQVLSGVLFAVYVLLKCFW